MDMRPISERTNQRAHLELFLLHLRYREGYFLRAEGNDALLLDDTEMVWIVYTSTVDVFASTWMSMALHRTVGICSGRRWATS